MDNEMDLRIIVIDDNPAIHRDFLKILTTNTASELDKLTMQLFGKQAEKSILPNFEIDTASQGQEGVERIKAALEEGRPYSLAFVDIRMPPGWDGIETIKHIWELDKDIQVVICTAYSDYSWEDTITHLGQTDNLLILKKPFDNVSVRQLACALTKKWQLLQDTRKHMQSLEQQVESRTLSLQQSLSELKHQATHDGLTGLANRVKLLDQLRISIKVSEQTQSKFALLFFDLDRFKLINDSLSHAVGDELLQAVSDRLTAATRSEDTIARLGGDEFVILLMNINKKEDVVAKIQHLLKVFHEPFQISGRSVIVTASIGVSLYPTDGLTIDVLLRNADAAMYQAKADKTSSYQFYSEEMSNQSLAILEKEMELRQAILNNEFVLCYQPQIDVATEKMVAVEALLRWHHPEKGIILPMEFIPLAEETGLIGPIGEWVMRTACQQLKAWHNEGMPHFRVAVNVTAHQFRQQNLIPMVKNILEETDLKPEYLELEITENVIISNTEIIRTITELKKLGVLIAMDDFGTGYSCLSYLHKIPLDRLKIDSSFVKRIETATDDEAIVRAVIAMAKSLDLEVLAEGVETESQLNFLKKNQCGDVQGYYFSKPLSSTELKEFINVKMKSDRVESENA